MLPCLKNDHPPSEELKKTNPLSTCTETEWWNTLCPENEWALSYDPVGNSQETKLSQFRDSYRRKAEI